MPTHEVSLLRKRSLKGKEVIMNLRQVGAHYEELAAKYLEKKGYQILAKQYRCHRGEIDLIAAHGEYIVFVEVKGRRTNRFGTPAEAVDWRKQRRLYMTARHFLWVNRLHDALCRFDVVAIYTKGPDRHCIQHVVGAFG